VCDDLDISQLKTATYQFLKHKISIYSYGDEWKRRFINLVSRGKSEALEANALDAFKELLGVNFKEVRFLVEDWGVYQIIEKLLKTKRIRTEPAIPEIVEKVLTNLVKAKIFKNPTKMAQRICYSCRAISWQDWQCPKCTRDMIIIGQEIQIRLSETDLVRHLFNTLSGTYSKDYEIHNKFRQRRGIKKRIVEITNRKTKVTTYVLLILERKDLEFLSELEKEGHGLICFYDLALANREMQILSYDSEAIPLTYLIASLHAIINSTKSEFATEFEKYLSSQESRILDRIYTKMQYSIRRLKEGKSYNEDMFEVDIKNIIQGLVPDVVRLGTEFKGKPVPDGYCGFKTTNVGSKKRLFGWDAKYSQSRQYALSASDLNKQKKYISWLTTTPEPKSLGKLYLYTIISNYDSLNGFKRVLHRLSRWSQKPRMCRILLLNTDLLINLAVWKLRNWKKVLENGPDIAKVFFSWLSSNSRNKLKRMKWRYSDASDWIGLEKQLDKI
jgi:hypothetical protein